jgi:hypothetical protein
MTSAGLLSQLGVLGAVSVWATRAHRERQPHRRPGGVHCVGNSKMLASSFPGVGATTQVSGFCRKGSTFGSPYFNWFIMTH